MIRRRGWRARPRRTQGWGWRSKVQSPNIFTAVVVYDRPSGLTSADKAKAAADLARFEAVAGVVRAQVAGPVVSRDGTAIETLVPVNLGSQGWNKASDTATSLRNIARADDAGMSVYITGPL